MEEPYATFDTFTVGENFAPGEDPLAPPPKAPVLARLPRLAVIAPTRTNRFDDPEKGLIGVHEGTHEPVMPAPTTAPTTAPPTTAPTVKGTVRGTDSPTATIRFDTVLTDDGFIETDRIKVDSPVTGQEPVAAREQAISMLEAPVSPSPQTPALYPAAEFDSWLLNLEATVMPYSRWIALAAVIAALGLTMVLLRGSAPVVIGDAPAPSSRADNLVATDAMAAVYETESTPEASPLDTGKGLQPLASSAGVITNTFATTAMGPTAHEAAAGQATSNQKTPLNQTTMPRAKLAQQVRPLEPYRVCDETGRVEMAMRPRPASYPRTAANGPLAPVTSDRSTLR